ncbi:MAG: hypothetical protein ABWY00_00080 [Dongiaceae bacterium]
MKPIYVYSLPRRELEPGGPWNEFNRHLRRRRERRKNAGLRRDLIDRLFDLMTESGHLRPRNNIDSFEATLYSQGIARCLGQGEQRSWALDSVTKIERNIVTERIRDLWKSKLSAKTTR